MARTSIEIDSFRHQNPIPAATRIGPLIESGIIPPFNDGERTLPDTLDAMIDNLFLHIGNILTAAAAGWDDVVKVTFFTSDPGAAREAVNAVWAEKFPDAASRPSRHTQHAPPRSGDKPMITCVFTAYVDR